MGSLESEYLRLQVKDAECKVYSSLEIYHVRDSTADLIAGSKVVSLCPSLGCMANEILTITCNFSITEKHLSSRHEEHGIRYIGYGKEFLSVFATWLRVGSRYLTVTRSHSSLHDNHLLALPCMKHRHASNRATRFEGDGINGIVCAND